MKNDRYEWFEVMLHNVMRRGISKMKDKYFTIERHFLRKAHPRSFFEVEILPGVLAGFGEPKSKLFSRKYQLAYLKMDFTLYPMNFLKNFWKRFHVKYLNKEFSGKKLPPIYRVIGTPQRLIHDGYIIICEPQLDIREGLKLQQTYDFWIDQFYKRSVISGDEETIRKTIPILINKISGNSRILKEIPFRDSRVIEEIVAEIFESFGYKVELTKKTRDGGKDIIALKKDNAGKDEKLLIECKHWNDKIDVSVIRELIGVAVTEETQPTGIIIATTSQFTRDAKKIKIHPSIPIELELKDYQDIINWTNKYDVIQFSEREINRYRYSLGLDR